MRRYSQFGKTLTAADGTEYKSGLPFVDWLYAGKIKFHRVDNDEVGRLDLIAWKTMGDPTLYWLLAKLNNIIDPIRGVYAGMDIAYPVDRVVLKEILAFTYNREA
jgi:hypothetical protein